MAKVGNHSVSRCEWEKFTFKLAAGEKTTIAVWLKKLSRTTAEIAAVSINREGIAMVRKLPNLRVIDDYEITEIDSSNFFNVRIEFGEWIRRGYNEQILDSGVYPLLTQPTSLKSKHIVTGV